MAEQFDPMYMTKVSAAFLNELSEIEKRAGIGGFLTGGIKTLSRLGAKGAQKVSLKGLYRGGRAAYRKGAAQGGTWGGVRGLAASRTGQAAGTAGLGGLAAYGGYKALGG